MSRDKDALLDMDVVWKAIEDDLPALRQQITAILEQIE